MAGSLALDQIRDGELNSNDAERGFSLRVCFDLRIPRVSMQRRKWLSHRPRSRHADAGPPRVCDINGYTIGHEHANTVVLCESRRALGGGMEYLRERAEPTGTYGGRCSNGMLV